MTSSIDQQRSVSVMVVDDHDMVLDGLRSGLDGRDRLRVVATAGNVADARRRLEELQPDVVVADLQLPDGSGLDIARAADSSRTIIVTGLERPGLVHEVVAAGARGLVPKSSSLADLADAVGVVARGGSTFSAEDLQILANLDPSDVGATLTPREREVLALLAEAESADAIASTLNLSIHTVRKHIAAVLTKLHANSQLEAVVTAQRAGLV